MKQNMKKIIIDSCEVLIYIIGVMFMIAVLVMIYKFSHDISGYIELMADKMGF